MPIEKRTPPETIKVSGGVCLRGQDGGLPVPVHVFVILLVVSACHVVHPFLIVEIPTDGFLDAFFELQAGFPAQFVFQFGGVDGVA